MTTFSRFLLAAALAGSVHAAFAADEEPARPDKLSPVRAQIAAKQWRGAIEALQRMGDTGSADWNNLMGYSLRKAKTPDLEAPNGSTTRRCASTPGTAARWSIRASCT